MKKNGKRGLFLTCSGATFLQALFHPFYPLFCSIFHIKGLLFDMEGLIFDTGRVSAHSAPQKLPDDFANPYTPRPKKRTGICLPMHPQTYPIAAAFIAHRTGICRAMQPHGVGHKSCPLFGTDYVKNMLERSKNDFKIIFFDPKIPSKEKKD